MANQTVTGTSGNDGVTLTNPIDSSTVEASTGNSAPSHDSLSVTVDATAGVTTSTGLGSSPYWDGYDVNMGLGDDTLVAENMVWAGGNGQDNLEDNGFDNIDMGGGSDFVSLNRSAVAGTLNTGSGADTLFMHNSWANNVDLGADDDLMRMSSDTSVLTEEEAEAKAATDQVMNLDGGTGNDTLNLMGDWTVTLSTGNATIDGTLVTNVVTSDQMNNSTVNLPSALSGTVSWGAMTIGSVTISAEDNIATFSNFESLDAVCFTAGTMIETPSGMVAVETLKAGDLVVTVDGVKSLSWVGKRRLSTPDLAGNPKLLPVRIPAQAFGNGLPTQDVSFSPQHRVVVRSPIAQRMFDSPEVLAPVKHLVGHFGIDVDGSVREVTYVHLMFNVHTCLRVYGIEAETMYSGPEAFKSVPKEALVELREIFGEEVDAIIKGDLVKDGYLPMLKGREARALAMRHSKNNMPLLSEKVMAASARNARADVMCGQ